jgi:hypothetical protein
VPTPPDPDRPTATADHRTRDGQPAAETGEERSARVRANRARAALDRALSASAGLVALCALGISFYQAYLTREQQRASVWPRLDLMMTTGGPAYARMVRNQGLGPALVRSVEVTVDGRPVRRWGEVARLLLGDSADAMIARDSTLTFEVNTVTRGLVIQPGTTVYHLRVENSPIVRRVERAAARRLRTRVCYCSLYNDCWAVREGADIDPAPVDACPARPDTAREFGG